MRTAYGRDRPQHSVWHTNWRVPDRIGGATPGVRGRNLWAPGTIAEG